jgi:hypothetical protein
MMWTGSLARLFLVGKLTGRRVAAYITTADEYAVGQQFQEAPT